MLTGITLNTGSDFIANYLFFFRLSPTFMFFKAGTIFYTLYPCPYTPIAVFYRHSISNSIVDGVVLVSGQQHSCDQIQTEHEKENEVELFYY